MMMMNAPKRALCSFRVVEEEKKFVVVDTSHHMHTSSRIIVRNTYYAHNASKKKEAAALRAGFEPTRALPNGCARILLRIVYVVLYIQVRLLNRSDI